MLSWSKDALSGRDGSISGHPAVRHFRNPRFAWPPGECIGGWVDHIRTDAAITSVGRFGNSAPWPTSERLAAGRMGPCYIGAMSPELIAILAGWISLAGLVLRLSGHIARVEARLAAVEKETARMGGLLEGLGLTGRTQATESAGWPRAVTHPRLPRFRACPIRAPGSSDDGLAAQRYTLCTTRAAGRG